MTVGIAIRVPGQGAVLACDSRIIELESLNIYTDSEQKFGVFGSCVALYAGSLGGLWVDLREDPPRNWSELRKKITDLEAADHDRSYDVLVYDRTKDRLLCSSHQGDGFQIGLYSGIGCGAAVALGVLDATRALGSLEAAAKAAHRAVKAACKRNAACGGKIRTLIVHGRKGPIDVR